MSRFQTPLDLRDENVESKHGVRFELLGPLVYASDYLGLTIFVPAGFVTDLASIPQALWAVLPPIGPYDEAAVVHDYLYQHGGGFRVNGRPLERVDADRVLAEACAVCGVSRIKRWAIFAGVRVGGWLPWREARKAETAGV